jgi:hypothetical protein
MYRKFDDIRRLRKRVALTTEVVSDGPRELERTLTTGWIEEFECYWRDTREEGRRNRVLAGLVLDLRRLDLSSFMRKVAHP